METPMVVVDADKDDAQLILSFIQKKAYFDGSIIGSAREVTTTLEKIERTILGENPFAKVLLAKNDEQEAVGFALYHTRYSSFSGCPSIWLDDLYTESSMRSKGVGLVMMNALKQRARDIDASHIAWTASALNTRGQEFYNRLGAEIDRVDGELLYYRLGIMS